MPDLSQFLSFVVPHSNNPYTIQGIAPSLLSTIMQSSTRSDLMAAAAKRVPDAATFAKAIMDRNLYPGTEAKFTSAIRSKVADFLNKYDKDPYYAFTKEGRDTVKELQNIATSPILAKREAFKSQMDAKFKEIDTNELAGNPIIDGSNVAVFRNGKRKMVPITQLKKNDVLITPSDDYYLANAGELTEVPDYNMSSYDDVMEKVRNSVANLGSDSWTELDTKFKSQKNAGKKRYEWLINQGLNKNDFNTLKSEYIRKYGAAGPNLDEKVSKWVLGTIANYVESSYDEENIEKPKGITPDANLGKNVGITGKEKYGYYNMVFSGNIGTPITQMSDSRFIPQALENDFRTKKDEQGNVMSVVIVNPRDIFDKIKKVPNTDISEGHLTLDRNPIIKAVADPTADVTTADDVPVEESRVIPDPSKPSFLVREGDDNYMYFYGIYADPGWWASDLEKESKYIGTYIPEERGFAVGPVGTYRFWDNDIPEVKQFKRINDTIESTTGERVTSEGFIDATNVYNGLFKVKLSDRYVEGATYLDNSKLIGPAIGMATPSTRQAVVNANTREKKFIEYEPE